MVLRRQTGDNSNGVPVVTPLTSYTWCTWFDRGSAKHYLVSNDLLPRVCSASLLNLSWPYICNNGYGSAGLQDCSLPQKLHVQL